MKHTSRHQCFVKQNKTEINLKMGWESSQVQDIYVTKDLWEFEDLLGKLGQKVSFYSNLGHRVHTE